MSRRESMERVLVRYGGQDSHRLREQSDHAVDVLVERLKRRLTIPDNAADFLPLPPDGLR